MPVRRSAYTNLHSAKRENIYCEYIMFPPLHASRPSTPSQGWRGEEGDGERNIEKGTVDLDRSENRFK